MATVDNQQSWLPYDASIGKDCSQGFCSIYCPQWCYTLFSPPPPLSLAAPDDDPTTAFSPLVIAVIAVLASALLLVSYYTFVSKKCASLFSTRLPIHSAAAAVPHQEQHASPANGLEEELINKIAVLRYKREDGTVDGTDCPVCLGEFRDEESLRLLPKCGHAFHLQCIDTWLKSHANCPLCRASVVVGEDENDEEMVMIVEEVRRCLSGGSSSSSSEAYEERVSIGDVLGMSMEEEYMVAKKCGLVGSGIWGREGEQSIGIGRNRGLNCVMRTVRMKRSVSSVRFFFGRQARGRNFLLPV